MPANRIAASFDTGKVPTITVVNQAKTPLGVDLDALIAALQKYCDQYIFPAYGLTAKLVKGSTVPKNSWVMVFLDDADVAGALAYHDLTADGFPIMKVFVRTTLQDKSLVSISASHELVETIVDPAINMLCFGPDGKTVYAYEPADPVEETSFPIAGIQMSNFVYASYFEGFRKAKSDQFDAMGLVSKPFQLLKGGYQSLMKNGKWTEVFGSLAKKKRFKKEDRRGHRSETRKIARLTKAPRKAFK